MQRLVLIGDSNIVRNVTPDRLAKRISAHVTLFKATKSQTFEAGLLEANKNGGDVLIVSALANILCDASAEVTLTELPRVITEVTTTYVSLVSKNSTAFKIVLLIPPLSRTTPAWFSDGLKNVNPLLSALSKSMPNLRLLPEFKVQVTDLLSDGVHLHQEAGQRFFEYISSCYLDTVQSLVVNDPVASAPIGNSMVTGASSPTIEDIWKLLQTSVVPQLSGLSTIEKKIEVVEQRAAARMSSDDQMFARHSEELDQIKNDRWADRVVIVNYSASNYPQTITDRKSFLAEKFRPLIEEILGEKVFDVYPRTGNHEGKIVPPFEVRFPTVADCRKFKQEAYKKVKDSPDLYGDIGLHPKMTLASRVRVEILRAIAKKVVSPSQSAYCPIYNPRPILHVGPLVDDKVERKETLTFVDAVLRFRHLLSINDLFFAYKRVGVGFHNCLRQMFLVMNDEDRVNFNKNQEETNTNQPNSGRGVKRGQETFRGRGSSRGKKSR